jgi:hypothetical protein
MKNHSSQRILEYINMFKNNICYEKVKDTTWYSKRGKKKQFHLVIKVWLHALTHRTGPTYFKALTYWWKPLNILPNHNSNDAKQREIYKLF